MRKTLYDILTSEEYDFLEMLSNCYGNDFGEKSNSLEAIVHLLERNFYDEVERKNDLNSIYWKIEDKCAETTCEISSNYLERFESIEELEDYLSEAQADLQGFYY